MTKIYRRMTALLLAILVMASGVAVSYSQNSNAEAGQTEEVAGTVVRFTSGPTSVDVTIGKDNPTVRDLLSLLPVTIRLEEYAGREKIGYSERKLTTDGSPGSDPEDAISFTSHHGAISAFTTTPPESAFRTRPFTSENTEHRRPSLNGLPANPSTSSASANSGTQEIIMMKDKVVIITGALPGIRDGESVFPPPPESFLA